MARKIVLCIKHNVWGKGEAITRSVQITGFLLPARVKDIYTGDET